MEKMEERLLQEVLRQLESLQIKNNNFSKMIREKYINLGTSYDMEPYVDVIEPYYYIRMCERRNIIIEHRTKDIKLTTYIILEDFLFKYEWNNLEDRYKWQIDSQQIITEKLKEHFEQFDAEYKEWFSKGLSIMSKLDQL